MVPSHRINGDVHLRAFDRDDLPALVVPAVRADAVRQLGLAALRTDGPSGRGELVVRPALAPSGFRVSSLGKRHEVSLRFDGARAVRIYFCVRAASVFKTARRGSGARSAQAQGLRLRLTPQTGHN